MIIFLCFIPYFLSLILEVNISCGDKTIQCMDHIISFSCKNKTVHGYCTFLIEHRHVAIQNKANIRFRNSNLKN